MYKICSLPASCSLFLGFADSLGDQFPLLSAVNDVAKYFVNFGPNFIPDSMLHSRTDRMILVKQHSGNYLAFVTSSVRAAGTLA